MPHPFADPKGALTKWLEDSGIKSPCLASGRTLLHYGVEHTARTPTTLAERSNITYCPTSEAVRKLLISRGPEASLPGFKS